MKRVSWRYLHSLNRPRIPRSKPRPARIKHSCTVLHAAYSSSIDQSQGWIVKYFPQVVLGAIFVALSLLLLTPKARAQDNYEIQVYSSEATPKNITMVEIHSNFTVVGSKQVINGVAPSNHAMHETLEIPYGWTDWFETGCYVFSSIQPGGSGGGGWNWGGDHIRPRITAPQSWRLPVGL